MTYKSSVSLLPDKAAAMHLAPSALILLPRRLGKKARVSEDGFGDPFYSCEHTFEDHSPRLGEISIFLEHTNYMGISKRLSRRNKGWSLKVYFRHTYNIFQFSILRGEVRM
jgi:hypothetical protein